MDFPGLTKLLTMLHVCVVPLMGKPEEKQQGNAQQVSQAQHLLPTTATEAKRYLEGFPVFLREKKYLCAAISKEAKSSMCVFVENLFIASCLPKTAGPCLLKSVLSFKLSNISSGLDIRRSACPNRMH